MATAILTSRNPNLIPSIQNFRGFGFILDSDNIPSYFNKNGGWDWMHKDPSTAITANESGAGTMSGVYKYMYTEMHRDSGDSVHSCHESNPSAIFTTGTLSSKKVVLTLPATGVNGFATHLKVYGTDAGNTILYYLGNVAIGTTSFEDDDITRDANVAFGKLDTALDGTVTQTYYNYPVKNHRYLIATKSRILVCGVKIKEDGTVAVTNGSATVTGTSSLWTRALVGDMFKVDGDTREYEVSAVGSTTSITLTEVYAGSTGSGSAYTIKGNDDIVRWSAKHPNTSKPMWWAFPTDFYKRILSKDYSPIMGCNKIGNQPVFFKEHSHYLFTENGDDFISQESRTQVGTCSHWSIVETSEQGTLIFMTYEGLIYESTGLEAKDLDIDLSKTVDGINKARLEYVQARWVNDKKWYMLLYSSEGSSVHDRFLIYDYALKEWVVWAIYANCIGLIESSESGQTVFKPWMGTTGGFVYKMLTGDNMGASSGTLEGTATAFGAATITDSGASFYVTDDGLEDVYVSLYDTDGDFQEKQKISSNTGTVITVDTSWTTSPQVGWSYYIGEIKFYWKSKVFDFDSDKSKSIDNVLINFKKLSSSQAIKIKFYFSEDADMLSDTSDQSIEFDLSLDYYDPLPLYDNMARYVQYEIWGHAVDAEIEINNLVIELETWLR